jgi:hypothetical protein
MGIAQWVTEHFEDNNVSKKLIVAQLFKIKRLSAQAGSPIDKDFSDYINLLQQETGDLDELVRMINKLGKQIVKESQRLTAPKPLPRRPTLCTNCHKREAHFSGEFGSLCKHCADELGVRPKGKVGES